MLKRKVVNILYPLSSAWLLTLGVFVITYEMASAQNKFVDLKLNTTANIKSSSQKDDSSNVRSSSVMHIDKRYTWPDGNRVTLVSVPLVYNNGILFTYAGQKNDKAYLSGSFFSWTQKIEMKRGKYGIHYIFLPLDLKKGEYSYRFFVNNIWLNDPEQPYSVNDGYGTKISTFYLAEAASTAKASVTLISIDENGGKYYRFFLRDKGYQKVSWVGNENLWDPYTDEMNLQAGYWTIEKYILPNQTFYQFYVNDKFMLDPQSEHVTRTEGNIYVNFIPATW